MQSHSEPPLTAHDLLLYLKEQAGGDPTQVENIKRYNTETGSWETASWFLGQPAGVDFAINAGEAYLIYMERDVDDVWFEGIDLGCGLDSSVGMLLQAKRKTASNHWFNAVGEWIPVRAGVFDCVFSSQVWHHIEDKQETANECGRVLRRGGSVVIRTISHEQLRRKVVFEFFPEIMENQLRVYPSKADFDRYFGNAGFFSTEHHAYELERYQPASEFIEIARKKLWSMFRPISEEGLERGVEKLRQFERDNPSQPVRNDETISLVVARK